MLSRLLNWHWWHSFLGLWCSIILFFIFLTGTLSVFGGEINWLLNDKMRVTPAQSQKISLAETYKAAHEARPDRPIARMYRREGARFADQLDMIAENGSNRFLWVDPYTGAFLGETSTTTFNEVISELHTRLFVPGRPGIMLVTVFSLALTGAAIAGAMLLPRFWRAFVTKPRWSGSTRALTSDLHRLSGAWLILFLIPMCATSLYYFAETLNLDAPSLETGTNTERRETRYADLSADDIAAMLETTRSTFPGIDITTVLLPRNRFQPVKIQGHHTAVLVRERANTVYFHPDTLNVISSHQGEELSGHQRISEAVDPIHWGYWGGLPSRIVWFLFGALLTAMPVMGAIIYAKRMGVRVAKQKGGPVSGWQVYWSGMGLGKWGAIGLVAVALALMMKSLLLH